MIPRNRPEKSYIAEDGISSNDLDAVLPDHLVKIVGVDGIIYAWQDTCGCHAQIWTFGRATYSASAPDIASISAWIIEQSKGLDSNWK